MEDLHSRHPFSFLASVSSSAAILDVAALDCEMIYTTGGFRVARVSIVDGSGKEVFDQLVRMDDGVHVMSVLLPFLLLSVHIETKSQRFQHPIFRDQRREPCYCPTSVDLYPGDAGYISRFKYHPYWTRP